MAINVAKFQKYIFHKNFTLIKLKLFTHNFKMFSKQNCQINCNHLKIRLGGTVLLSFLSINDCQWSSHYWVTISNHACPATSFDAKDFFTYILRLESEVFSLKNCQSTQMAKVIRMLFDPVVPFMSILIVLCAIERILFSYGLIVTTPLFRWWIFACCGI